MIIYLTTNLVNEKIYVGQTMNPNNQHQYFGHGDLIISAVEKYGKENFFRRTVYQCSNLEEMNRLEEYYINFFDARNLDIAYNIRPGGSNSLLSDETRKKMAISRKGKTHSEETKNKMSESQQGHTVSEETKKKISDATKGRFYGIPRTKEVKEKISNALRGERCPTSILSEDQVIKIRSIYSDGNHTQKLLAELFKVSRSCIEGIIKRRRWKHI